MGKHPCEGCVDAVQDVNGVDGYRCDYIGHNRRSRLKICPPREKCTVKSTVPRDGVEYVSIDRAGYVMRQKRRGPKEKINRDEVRRLAGQGWSDPAISKALGFSKNAVFKCRQRYGIPPGQPRRGR